MNKPRETELTIPETSPLKIEDYDAGVKKVTEGLSQDEIERRYKDMVMSYDADRGF